MDLEPSVIDEMRTGMYRYVSVSCVFFPNQMFAFYQLFEFHTVNCSLSNHWVIRKLRIPLTCENMVQVLFFCGERSLYDRSTFPSTVFAKYIYTLRLKLRNIKHLNFFQLFYHKRFAKRKNRLCEHYALNSKSKLLFFVLTVYSYHIFNELICLTLLCIGQGSVPPGTADLW